MERTDFVGQFSMSSSLENIRIRWPWMQERRRSCSTLFVVGPDKAWSKNGCVDLGKETGLVRLK